MTQFAEAFYVLFVLNCPSFPAIEIEGFSQFKAVGQMSSPVNLWGLQAFINKVRTVADIMVFSRKGTELSDKDVVW